VTLVLGLDVSSKDSALVTRADRRSRRRAQSDIPIDVRVIAATNRNLERPIKEGTFREDLYYRLKVVRIQTPTLCEIDEDIPVIAKHFLAKHCGLGRGPAKKFAPAAIQTLKKYY
jgi:DNA-binding NtrC family response regulator